MAVIATPVAAPPSSDVTCANQSLLLAEVTEVDGCEVLGKRLSVTTRQGHAPTIEWVMRDSSGNPVDLTTCGFTFSPECSSSSSSSSADTADCGTLKFKMVESLSLGVDDPLPEIVEPQINIVDEGTGRVRVALTSTHTASPGVYLAEIVVIDPDGDPIFSNIFYLNVERSLSGGETTQGGPPAIAEIRLHMRDNAAADNLLLDRIDFDYSELNLAIQRPIQFWNEIPPPIKRYTTSTFPFRWAWLEGVSANLALMAEEHYRRNDLQYSAAGLSIADKTKFQLYAEYGARRWAAYQQWVRQKKASINLESCFGSVGSLYGYTYTAGDF